LRKAKKLIGQPRLQLVVLAALQAALAVPRAARLPAYQTFSEQHLATFIIHRGIPAASLHCTSVFTRVFEFIRDNRERGIPGKGCLHNWVIGIGSKQTVLRGHGATETKGGCWARVHGWAVDDYDEYSVRYGVA
jgi:hypothetical protein